MTVTITHEWKCDLCGGPISEPTKTTYYAHGVFPEPRMPVAQWRHIGGCWDLCGACAERVHDLVVKIARAEWAKDEAEAAS